MFSIDEDFLDKLLANLVNKDKNSITLSMKDTKLNMELTKSLVQTLSHKIKEPLKNLDYSLSLTYNLSLIDIYIDEYILESQDIIERWLDEYYWTGANCAYEALSAEIKKNNIDYIPIGVERPENLYPLMNMLQRNIEDYGLVLRGRLRSIIEYNYWRRRAYDTKKK